MAGSGNQGKSGEVFKVGDPRIWAEIFYLDSATDYREYLVPDFPAVLQPKRNEKNEGLVITDPLDNSPWRTAAAVLSLLGAAAALWLALARAL